MSDLLQRLRNQNYLWTVPGALREEAAAEIERLLTLLRDALHFVIDAGDDEDPEANTAALEIAEKIRCALGQARKE